jgi:hypothetical protein
MKVTRNKKSLYYLLAHSIEGKYQRNLYDAQPLLLPIVLGMSLFESQTPQRASDLKKDFTVRFPEKDKL